MRKPHLKIAEGDFSDLNLYAPGMEIGALLAKRLRHAITTRGVTQSAVASAAGISGGGLSGILNRTIQQNGKPATMSLDNLEKACAMLRVPVWAVLHEDQAILDLFLSDDPRMAEMANVEPAKALTSAMAIVSEARASAAASPDAAELVPQPRRPKAISRPRAPKKAPQARSKAG